MIAWLKLLRLPNMFTAVADVMMGYLVTHGRLQPAEHVGLLIAASCLLYLSGMVLNDVFDADVDARERPERPIPSGAVSLRAATAVGWGLLIGGVVVAWIASAMTSDWRPGGVASLLAVAILMYDGVLKRTVLAPVLMGACRGLNVMLGMSLAPLAAEAASPEMPWIGGGWFLAAGLGVYVAGVTVFARTEARASSRWQLVLGFVVIMSGIGMMAGYPGLDEIPRLVVAANGWLLLWAALAVITARRCVVAILQPTPKLVQAAVRHCVHSIIVLDAAVCVGFAGPYWGLVVLSLLAPTIVLTMWLDAT